jgi:hypothetical protein
VVASEVFSFMTGRITTTAAPAPSPIARMPPGTDPAAAAAAHAAPAAAHAWQSPTKKDPAAGAGRFPEAGRRSDQGAPAAAAAEAGAPDGASAAAAAAAAVLGDRAGDKRVSAGSAASHRLSEDAVIELTAAPSRGAPAEDEGGPQLQAEPDHRASPAAPAAAAAREEAAEQPQHYSDDFEAEEDGGGAAAPEDRLCTLAEAAEEAGRAAAAASAPAASSAERQAQGSRRSSSFALGLEGIALSFDSALLAGGEASADAEGAGRGGGGRWMDEGEEEEEGHGGAPFDPRRRGYLSLDSDDDSSDSIESDDGGNVGDAGSAAPPRLFEDFGGPAARLARRSPAPGRRAWGPPLRVVVNSAAGASPLPEGGAARPAAAAFSDGCCQTEGPGARVGGGAAGGGGAASAVGSSARAAPAAATRTQHTSTGHAPISPDKLPLRRAGGAALGPAGHQLFESTDSSDSDDGTLTDALSSDGKKGSCRGGNAPRGYRRSRRSDEDLPSFDAGARAGRLGRPVLLGDDSDEIEEDLEVEETAAPHAEQLRRRRAAGSPDLGLTGLHTGLHAGLALGAAAGLGGAGAVGPLAAGAARLPGVGGAAAVRAGAPSSVGGASVPKPASGEGPVAKQRKPSAPPAAAAAASQPAAKGAQKASKAPPSAAAAAAAEAARQREHTRHKLLEPDFDASLDQVGGWAGVAGGLGCGRSRWCFGESAACPHFLSQSNHILPKTPPGGRAPPRLAAGLCVLQVPPPLPVPPQPVALQGAAPAPAAAGAAGARRRGGRGVERGRRRGGLWVRGGLGVWGSTSTQTRSNDRIYTQPVTHINNATTHRPSTFLPPSLPLRSTRPTRASCGLLPRRCPRAAWPPSLTSQTPWRAPPCCRCN